MEISVKDYAARRGCSPTTVYQAAKLRRFRIRGGLLDPAAADKAWPAGEPASENARPKMSQRVIAWIQRRGVSATARDLEIHPRAVFKYIQGTISPRPEKAAQRQALASVDGHVFALEEFYTPTTKKEHK